jgi:hypothetical protein
MRKAITVAGSAPHGAEGGPMTALCQYLRGVWRLNQICIFNAASAGSWSLMPFTVDLEVYQLLLATFERCDEPPRLVAPARPGLLWI